MVRGGERLRSTGASSSRWGERKEEMVKRPEGRSHVMLQLGECEQGGGKGRAHPRIFRLYHTMAPTTSSASSSSRSRGTVMEAASAGGRSQRWRGRSQSVSEEARKVCF